MKHLRWLSTICAAIGLAWCVIVGSRIWTTPVRYTVQEWAISPAGARSGERVETGLALACATLVGLANKVMARHGKTAV